MEYIYDQEGVISFSLGHIMCAKSADKNRLTHARGKMAGDCGKWAFSSRFPLDMRPSVVPLE